jgi:hypothetical protein
MFRNCYQHEFLYQYFLCFVFSFHKTPTGVILKKIKTQIRVMMQFLTKFFFELFQQVFCAKTKLSVLLKMNLVFFQVFIL